MTNAPLDTLRAPPPRLLALELRAWTELGRLPLHYRTLLRELPRGDGHAVMVLPGFGAGDATTLPLRHVLNKLGYASYGWAQGVNLGMRGPMRQALTSRLHLLGERHHGPVSLIGWSLGGVFAREIARHQPQAVRRVITLGSPINGHPSANNMDALFKLMNPKQAAAPDMEGFRRRIVAPPVPCTAIYTRTDGIVAWPCCMEDEADNTENVEVHGSHMGLPFNAEVIRVIAQRLAKDA
ncbi:alpha/beta hydrolase [Sinimarinibacterium sp. CAU 1509]|uniref:alpha/beta fold hydrolase n=1 Tax=Sinimarinibacterium sp. CAU 1509 TaxID=2562283 RepID=UPI0010AC8000|nr:alpha/beta hydrolase [Sinimarinibacterium sp. CAU 1509]TJY63118.1 alpha/beta hydrolase [Sinimarinibacterium sp. CAU 1509]